MSKITLDNSSHDGESLKGTGGAAHVIDHAESDAKVTKYTVRFACSFGSTPNSNGSGQNFMIDGQTGVQSDSATDSVAGITSAPTTLFLGAYAGTGSSDRNSACYRDLCIYDKAMTDAELLAS